jgi:hypothetical protein
MPNSFSVDSGDSLFDSSMSRFTFTYEEGNSKVSHSFHNIYCPEIVENFKHFMQGCGFFESNLMAAMSTMVEEYEMMEEKRAESSFTA